MSPLLRRRARPGRRLRRRGRRHGREPTSSTSPTTSRPSTPRVLGGRPPLRRAAGVRPVRRRRPTGRCPGPRSPWVGPPLDAWTTSLDAGRLRGRVDADPRGHRRRRRLPGEPDPAARAPLPPDAVDRSPSARRSPRGTRRRSRGGAPAAARACGRVGVARAVPAAVDGRRVRSSPIKGTAAAPATASWPRTGPRT